ncbi:MAG: hypothetical protein V7666_07185 [Sulfitobacter sp.]|jgi:hypothetical protein|uniref:hypothetical protein n=1 Tax=Sulfitobacter sp. TaxID=1903071 RepID=UPI001110C25C|tara:strand:- start:99 stop:476 length:378 start_codon:yes stop_codon:yes gene_type:complete
MFEYVTDRVALKATRTAQTAAIGFGAMLCLIVGGAFLAVAFWLFLLTFTSALVACLILGSLFFGLGFVLIAALSIRARAIRLQKREAALRAQAMQQAQATGGVGGIAAIIMAFVNGLNAGKQARH